MGNAAGDREQWQGPGEGAAVDADPAAEDETHDSGGRTDRDIKDILEAGMNAMERVRCRCVEKGLEVALLWGITYLT